MMMTVLPSSEEAILPVSPLAAAFFACGSAFIDSKRVLLSAVARSALPRGSRKLRAKPSFTRTTSPIWPSLPMRSSRITSIVVTPLSCPLSSLNSRLACARAALCRDAPANIEAVVGEAENGERQNRPAEHHYRRVDAAENEDA